MFTFLPALILLLLHGPAHMEGRMVRAGERADVPAAMPVIARTNRAFLAELLRKFPGATVLVALAEGPVAETKPVQTTQARTSAEPKRPHFPAPPGSIQRLLIFFRFFGRHHVIEPAAPAG